MSEEQRFIEDIKGTMGYRIHEVNIALCRAIYGEYSEHTSKAIREKHEYIDRIIAEYKGEGQQGGKR